MSSDDDLDSRLNNLIEEVASEIKSRGFVRRKRTLRSLVGANAALIDFQKSDRSSSQRLVFTINLGTVCGALLVGGGNTVEKADISDSHLRTRLGMLFDKPGDKWWEISRATDLVALQQELSEAIAKFALPFLQTYTKNEALKDLWQSGKSPGLTEVQRSRFLARLTTQAESKT